MLQATLVLMPVEAYMRSSEALGLATKNLACTSSTKRHALGHLPVPWIVNREIEHWSRRRHIRLGQWTDAVGEPR